jgi:DNA repair protein RecO (recombination protein O)
VLRHNNYGEADRFLTIFTRELGKVRAIAKGVRKLRSRKAGHLEPFTRSSLLLARGREMYIVTQAETIEVYLQLSGDMAMQDYSNVSYVVELLDRFTYEEGENRALYHLLVNTLTRLSTVTDHNFPIRYYEIRLLDLLGFRPQLFNCARCRKEIQPQDQYFSADEGGVLCPTCGRGTPGVRPISTTALKYFRHFQRSNYGEAKRANISPDIHREMGILMHHYLTYLLEKNLNTPAFFRRVMKGEYLNPEQADN